MTYLELAAQAQSWAQEQPERVPCPNPMGYVGIVSHDPSPHPPYCEGGCGGTGTVPQRPDAAGAACG